VSADKKIRHREYMREYHRKHPEANRAKVQKWVVENPEKAKALRYRQKLRLRYKLTPEQVAAMLSAQQQRCAVCETPIPTKRGWCVDHCHASGRVRGILCHPCNTTLGMAKENPLRLRKAADYLDRHLYQEK